MHQEALERAVKDLKDTNLGGQHTSTIHGLEDLRRMGSHKLKAVRKRLKEALQEAQRVPSTGEGSFNAVAERMQHVLPREMLEALVVYSRDILMQAKLGEEEVVGLRLYTGAFWVWWCDAACRCAVR